MTQFANAKLEDHEMDYEKAKRLLQQLNAKDGNLKIFVSVFKMSYHDIISLISSLMLIHF